MVISVSGSYGAPCADRYIAAIASRSASTPGIGAYWLRPSRMWRATASISAGIAVEVGEALRQVDRAELGRQPRHHREDRRADRRAAASAADHDSPLEDAVLPVLPDLVPAEVLAVHRDVDAGRQHLRERQRAAQIEQAVGAAERVGHHRAGQDDRPVVEPGRGKRPRGLDHRVRAVRDDDRSLGARRGTARRSARARRRPSPGCRPSSPSRPRRPAAIARAAASRRRGCRGRTAARSARRTPCRRCRRSRGWRGVVHVVESSLRPECAHELQSASLILSDRRARRLAAHPRLRSVPAGLARAERSSDDDSSTRRSRSG